MSQSVTTITSKASGDAKNLLREHHEGAIIDSADRLHFSIYVDYLGTLPLFLVTWVEAKKLRSTGAELPSLVLSITCRQGPTGRCFQLRDGSGSCIGKNFGFGCGSGSGIGTAFLSIGYYRELKS